MRKSKRPSPCTKSGRYRAPLVPPPFHDARNLYYPEPLVRLEVVIRPDRGSVSTVGIDFLFDSGAAVSAMSSTRADACRLDWHRRHAYPVQGFGGGTVSGFLNELTFELCGRRQVVPIVIHERPAGGRDVPILGRARFLELYDVTLGIDGITLDPRSA
jgi:hypothetical protein